MSLATPEKIRRLQRKLYVKAKEEPAYRFYQLYDKVYREDILKHAYRVARAKYGAPGADGVSFAAIETRGLAEWLAGLRRELHEKTYRPDPVRRVMIPKPGGGERPLGIPTVRDRVVQTAAKMVLEPIFEANFEDSAYGYRPGRSAQDAVQQVHRALIEGYTDVVDADLSKYFDTIPHAELMQSVARRVVDRQLLKLIKAWLKAPVAETDDQGKRSISGGKKSKRGTPQGGVISPLLANVYMHRYLRAWRERNKGQQYRARIVAYADDFVILSRGHADEALEWSRWAMGRLGLTLNETKTCIRNARREPFDFLGYTFGPDWSRWKKRWNLTAKPSRRSIQQVKRSVRAALRPGNQAPWTTVRKRLNRITRGWGNYFSYGARSKAFTAVDHYVYHNVRNFLRRRHKVPSRGTQRFSYHQVFGAYGVLRLRTLKGTPPARAWT